MTEPPLEPALDDLPATARALLTTLQEQVRTLQRENAALRQQLDVLCQRMFGKKSERVDPRQLQLALEQLANEPGPATEPIEMDSGDTPVRGHTRRRPTGRRPLPAHLPRRRVEIDLPDADKRCACGHTKTRIGESVAEKLEYQPASFVVIETVRAKYACPHCHEGVMEAPAPPQAVEKSLAGEGLLAHVVVTKYVDHTPLHRLSGIFAREGVDLPRTTLCDWVADVAAALTPIGDQLRREIVAADYLQTDDTTVTILDERGGSYKGRLWTYLDPLAKQVVFDATPTHERDGPATFLATFRGQLQADAYTGYDGLYQTGRVLEIGCWAHARRGFVEAFMIDTAAALMIALIQQLYDVERDGVDLDPAHRVHGEFLYLTPPSAFDRAHDSALPSDARGDSHGRRPCLGSILADSSPAPHALDDRCSSAGNRRASSPDRQPSRIGCGPGIRAESCRSAVQRMDARAVRTGRS